MYCLFGTYTGDDVGIHAFDTYQGETGHHIVLMGTTSSELDYPDGAVIDCTATDSLPMADLEPLILPTGGNAGGGYFCWQNPADNFPAGNYGDLSDSALYSPVLKVGASGTTLSFVEYVEEFPYCLDNVLPILEERGIRQPVAAAAAVV
mgnify:CR=1 FL=1